MRMKRLKLKVTEVWDLRVLIAGEDPYLVSRRRKLRLYQRNKALSATAYVSQAAYDKYFHL